MSGRGDNNKSGSSGQGASNQSNQAFGSKEDHPKSDQGEKTGGSASEPQSKTADQDANRNESLQDNPGT